MVFIFQQAVMGSSSSSSKQQSQQVSPVEMQSWANQNYPAVASVLRDHCRRDGIDKCEVMFPKNAQSRDEFRLDVSHKGETVNSFVVTISKDASGADSYQVKPLAEADKETKAQWGKGKSSYQVIPRIVKSEERIELPYNSTCVKEGGFDPITRVSGPNDKASEVFYNGNAISTVSLTVQDDLKNKTYNGAISSTSSKMNKLFNSPGNTGISYVAEFPSDIKKSPVLYNLLSTLDGSKNAQNFAVVKESTTNADFLIPGKNAENIQEGKTTVYFLLPRYQSEKDEGNTIPTASGTKATNFLPQTAIPLRVVPDEENKNMVNFVLNGKAVASQDRSKAGVPFIKKIISQDIKNEDGSITKISGEYEIVPAVKVMSYRNEMDGSVLGTATSGFDGKTKLEMADGSTVKPKAGQYRLFVGEVENDSGKMETKVIAIQPLSDAKLPKGISKEADYLMLDTKSIYEQLDMKNAHLTVITVPSNIKSPERAVDWQQGELQNYLSDIGGGLKSIPPTEANFNFSASTRNIESLKPEALSSLVTKELRKTEFTISP